MSEERIRESIKRLAAIVEEFSNQIISLVESVDRGQISEEKWPKALEILREEFAKIQVPEPYKTVMVKEVEDFISSMLGRRTYVV